MSNRHLYLIGMMLFFLAGLGFSEDLPDTTFPWGVYVATGISDSLHNSMKTVPEFIDH